MAGARTKRADRLEDNTVLIAARPEKRRQKCKAVEDDWRRRKRRFDSAFSGVKFGKGGNKTGKKKSKKNQGFPKRSDDPTREHLTKVGEGGPEIQPTTFPPHWQCFTDTETMV